MVYSAMRYGVCYVSRYGVPGIALSSSASIWQGSGVDDVHFEVLAGGTRVIVEEDGNWAHDEDLDDGVWLNDYFNDEPADVDGMEFAFDFYGEGVAA